MKKIRVLSLLLALALCMSLLPAAGAQDGGTLVYGSGDYTRINPAMDEHCEINVLLFDGLTDHDGENNIIPRLARSWEYDEEAMTYTFHLEQGVKWHDGAEFTAEDVKFTIEDTAEIQKVEMQDHVPKALLIVNKKGEFLDKITLLDNVRIALRTPDQVGIYTVYAITNNDNYNTGFGMGALVVKKHYSGVKLDWNQNFTNGKLTQKEAKDFDFGATLRYNGKQVEDQSSVHYLYSGFTSKWKPYSSTKAPTEPGRYVMTVVTLGGNYQAAPMTRSFQITK